MKNASALSSRPRFAFQRKTSAWNLFHTVVIAGAVALPLLALAPTARADGAKPVIPASGTLREVLTRGSFLVLEGMDPIEVSYTPDGKFTAMGGVVKGTWRVDGDALCTTTNFEPNESCAIYPRDKKSGDTFDVSGDQGLVQIRIK